ncbi:sensor domain-containing diguanylate cyclase [Acinetobacter sp. ANC 3791]|uniref:sensor domain-containing diguanylate cyclase n=1 Tax=Acinetobacter sp. ANC 3791 TaxID=2529836 RepID=UPI00103F2342|nr:sensor domain-containing diguanylate cyclase [Acinetobacter sp. ANC 3791]TCB82955.1 diguanylate cyclase [Acinetobacter sp. ANC 3791]
MFQMDSFRNRLLVLFTALSFTLGLCITLYIGKIASEQMAKEKGQILYLSAKSISNTLANSLTEREREIVLLGQSPFFAEADFHNPRVQLKLDQVKKSYQYYAWLGIANPLGKVEVAANQLLQGTDVTERPWFINGLHHVYLGDVHKAVLLAKKIKAINPNEPMRFIDFATPIYDPVTHKVKGVLAAHADWSWASHVLNSSLSQDATEKGIEVFIVNKNGEILYPFKRIGQVKPPAFNQQRSIYFLDHWNENKEYLTTDVPVLSKTQMSLGWHVVIRQPVAIALADVRSLQHQIMLIGVILSLVLMVITYKLANKFSAPIEILARTAHAVEHGQENLNFETKTTIREIKALSQSLESMTETLLSQKHQLEEANLNLEKKVQERTQELEIANNELAKLARYDALTGLHNRRAFNNYIEYLFEQMSRTQQVYAVLLMDIDFFKKVNDTYGHEVGDHVLQRVAELLPSAIRTTDFVARFGGEEFVVLLPATVLDEAVLVAEKIRQTIAQENIIENHPITASIGVSVALQQDAEVNDTIRRADKCLYIAKEQGRNQVVALSSLDKK